VEKETVDEIIFRTQDQRNRLILELMARGGMRIGEVLKLTPSDIDGAESTFRRPRVGGKLRLPLSPKAGSSLERVHPTERGRSEGKIFSITYPAARIVVKKAGELVGISLRPHDLRRHAATYASRSGTPIEIVSKVILRHANLATTQRYLGKVTDLEAMRWIESLHG